MAYRLQLPEYKNKSGCLEYFIRGVLPSKQAAAALLRIHVF
jgi:hypothetical protein